MIRRQKKGTKVRVTFALPTDEPTGRVSLVGNFNDWTPDTHRLTRRANGTRSVAIEAAPGEFIQFRYLGENGLWFDDPDIDGRHDENGVICA